MAVECVQGFNWTGLNGGIQFPGTWVEIPSKGISEGGPAHCCWNDRLQPPGWSFEIHGPFLHAGRRVYEAKRERERERERKGGWWDERGCLLLIYSQIPIFWRRGVRDVRQGYKHVGVPEVDREMWLPVTNSSTSKRIEGDPLGRQCTYKRPGALPCSVDSYMNAA